MENVIDSTSAKVTSEKKVGKLLLSWDFSDIIQGQKDFLKETGDYPDSTDDELFEMASGDPDLFPSSWECLCDGLTELMAKNKHGGWLAEVKNFGWQARSGHKHFQAQKGRELLSAVLPETECSFKIFRYGRGLAIQNSHHDSPMGNEWYYITPKKAK